MDINSILGIIALILGIGTLIFLIRELKKK